MPLKRPCLVIKLVQWFPHPHPTLFFLLDALCPAIEYDLFFFLIKLVQQKVYLISSIKQSAIQTLKNIFIIQFLKVHVKQGHSLPPIDHVFFFVSCVCVCVCVCWGIGCACVCPELDM